MAFRPRHEQPGRVSKIRRWERHTVPWQCKCLGSLKQHGLKPTLRVLRQMELQQVLNEFQRIARCACNNCLTKDQPVTVRIQGTERQSWGDQVEAVRPLPPPPPMNDRMRRDVKVEDRELGPPRSPTRPRKPAYPLASVLSEIRKTETDKRKKIYGQKASKNA